VYEFAFVTELKVTMIADAAPVIVLAAKDAGVESFTELIAIENEDVVAVAVFVSVKVTVIANVPAAVGVPETTPVAPSSNKPPGRDPDAIEKVPDPEPPLFERVSE
jgi:2-methylaconitate cis-trans-isomerase PrpF